MRCGEHRCGNNLNDPACFALMGEHMDAALFMNHPYRIPIIGWRSEMEQLSRDDALDFYARTFGLHSVHEEVNEEQGVREAMLAVGDSDTRIQLLAPLSEESTIAKFIGRSGPGCQQVAYRVTDVEQVSAILRERGLRLLYDAPKRGTSDSRINFVHPKDAGGILVELVEPASSPAH